MNKILALALLIGCGAAYSALFSPASLDLLTSGSDLIVVGRVSGITAGAATSQSTPDQTIPGNQQTATIQVLRVLKGRAATASLSVGFFQRGSGIAQTLSQGQVALFFLSTPGAQQWTFTDSTWYGLPALATPPASGSGVEAELGQVAASSAASSRDRITAIDLLTQSSTAISAPAFRAAATSGDRDLYWHATVALLASGDLETLSASVSALNGPFPDSERPYLPAIAAALEGEVKDQRAWPLLVMLLSSVNLEIREGAASAIASARSAFTLSALSPLLTDGDKLTRYEAVLGLGKTLHRSNETPTYDLYSLNEDAWLSYWKGQLPITAGPAPAITDNGVVPVFSSSIVIQSGSWVSIYGSNLSTNTVVWNGDFPQSLAGTSVTVNGKPAFLWYASPAQINLQAPEDAGAGTVEVVVTTPGGSATSTAILGQFAPSFSLLDGSHVAGVILRSDHSGAYGGGTYDILGPTGNSLGYPTIAAKTGDTVALFGVGFGPTVPHVPAGQIYSGSAKTAQPVTLFLDGIAVTPSFAGLTSAGLYQINFVVPSGIGTGDLKLAAGVGQSMTQNGVAFAAH